MSNLFNNIYPFFFGKEYICHMNLHMQFYIALSRVKNKNGLGIMLKVEGAFVSVFKKSDYEA